MPPFRLAFCMHVRIGHRTLSVTYFPSPSSVLLRRGEVSCIDENTKGRFPWELFNHTNGWKRPEQSNPVGSITGLCGSWVLLPVLQRGLVLCNAPVCRSGVESVLSGVKHVDKKSAFRHCERGLVESLKASGWRYRAISEVATGIIRTTVRLRVHIPNWLHYGAVLEAVGAETPG